MGSNLLVKPFRRMDFVSLQGSVVRIHARELHVFAEVVPSLLAQKTRLARHARLDRDAVSRLEIHDVFANADDHAGRFVPDDAISLKHKSADLPRLPEMNI